MEVIMVRRRRKSASAGIAGGGMITAWALLLSWLFCPPICIFLIVLLLVSAGIRIYAFFKTK
jgi:hypothetical protein